MRGLFVCGLAALLMACAPAEEGDGMAAGCDARAVSAWEAGEARLNVETSTHGPDCSRAVALIVIRDASGAPLYAETHLPAQVMTLAGATDRAAMQTALSEWADSSNATMATTSALPEWPANAEAPQSGEFPFYPDEGVDREAYAALRAQNLPLFCYVQGMESLRCLWFNQGEIGSVGVQLFPG